MITNTCDKSLDNIGNETIMKYSITRLSNQLVYLPHIIDTRRGSSLDSYGDTQLLQSSLANLIAMGPQMSFTRPRLAPFPMEMLKSCPSARSVYLQVTPTPEQYCFHTQGPACIPRSPHKPLYRYQKDPGMPG
jgi:hypothetical protein